MKLYLIRHTDAVQVGEGGVSDSERYLTSEGRAEARRVAGKLSKKGAKFDGILTSPYVRAVQTAEIVAAHAGFEAIVEALPALASGRWSRRGIAEALSPRPASGQFALVGHNPDMEEMASALMGVSGTAVTFRKGTVGCFEVDGDPFQAQARLVWTVEA